MMQSLLSQSAREVISDHRLFAAGLTCIPYDLYRPLLDAAFTLCHPLVIAELVQRWPERILIIGHERSRDQRQCESALLQAALKGLSDKRCRLRVLDLCRLKDIRLEDPKFGWSRTVAVCFMLLQARNVTDCLQWNGLDEPRVKKKKATERDSAYSAERAEPAQVISRKGILLDIFANLFVNSRTWDLVHRALRVPGPLRLHCRFLHVEDLPVSSIVTLLHLIPQQELASLILCTSSLGVSGLLLLLPQLALFPKLRLLQLCYCNLDMLLSPMDEQEEMRALSRGFGELKSLRRLSLTGLHMPGFLPMVLSSLPEPLEVLVLPDFSLTSDDMAYLSRSPHASTLTKLDLSDNRLDESCLHSLQHLLTQAKGSLMQLSLCSCGISDSALKMLLPFLVQCRSLRCLHLALNPLSRGALVGLVRAVAGIHSLKLLLCPKPLEEYELGGYVLHTRANLINYYLSNDSVVTLMQLEEVLRAQGCTQELLLTFSLSKYLTEIDVDY